MTRGGHDQSIASPGHTVQHDRSAVICDAVADRSSAIDLDDLGLDLGRRLGIKGEYTNR